MSDEPTWLDAPSVSVRPIWMDWPADGEGWHILDESLAARAYQLWRFAATLAAQPMDDVARGTVVQKLWNAVDQRLRVLTTTHRLSRVRELLALPRKTDSLEILHRLGLVRPLIIRGLKDIRNRIEHQDQGAPSSEHCANLVDSVWYFLRSTDGLATQRLDTFVYSSGTAVAGATDREHFIELHVDPDWSIHLRGWVHADDVAATPTDAHARIVVTLDEIPRLSGVGGAYLSGVVDPSSPLVPAMVRDYFSVGIPRDALGGTPYLSPLR